MGDPAQAIVLGFQRLPLPRRASLRGAANSAVLRACCTSERGWRPDDWLPRAARRRCWESVDGGLIFLRGSWVWNRPGAALFVWRGIHASGSRGRPKDLRDFSEIREELPQVLAVLRGPRGLGSSQTKGPFWLSPQVASAKGGSRRCRFGQRAPGRPKLSYPKSSRPWNFVSILLERNYLPSL